MDRNNPKYNIVLSRMRSADFDSLADHVNTTSQEFDQKIPLIYLFNEYAFGDANRGCVTDPETSMKNFQKIQKGLKENTYIFTSTHEINGFDIPFTVGYIVSSSSIGRQRKRNFNNLDTGHEVSVEVIQKLKEEADEMDVQGIEYISRNIGDKKIELRICGDITRPFDYKLGNEPYMTLVPARNLFTIGDIPVEKIATPSKVVIVNEDTSTGEQAEIIYSNKNRRIGVTSHIDEFGTEQEEGEDPRTLVSPCSIGKYTLKTYKDEDKFQQSLLEDKIRLHILE